MKSQFYHEKIDKNAKLHKNHERLYKTQLKLVEKL
jgi:hypothetical protein